MSIGEKMVAVFMSPRKAFEAISGKPDWLAPMIVIVLVGILFVLTVVPKVILPETMERTVEQMRDKGATDAQIEQVMKYMSGPLPITFGIIGVLIITPVSLLIISGILFGVASLFGGKTKFVQVLGGVTYSGLIPALGSVVKGILMLVQNSAHAGTSLALLLSEDASKTFLFRLLGHFDLFTLWQIVVLIIGLGVIYKWKTAKSAGVVLPLWILWVLISSALGGIVHVGAA